MSSTKYHMDNSGNPVVCLATIKCRKKGEDGKVSPHFKGEITQARGWAENIVAQDHKTSFVSLKA